MGTQPINPHRDRVKGEPDCDYCMGTGIIPPGMKAVRVCECRAGSKDLEGICTLLAAKIKRIHPDWAVKMHAAMDERHWTYTQMVGACIAYVYERGLHMTMPKDEFFAEGAPEVPVTATCALEGCGKEFKPQWPGQAFCSQDCGVRALPKRKVVETIDPVETNPVVPTIVTEQQAQQTFPLYGDHDEFADA